MKKVSIGVSGSWLSASLISTSRRSCPGSRDDPEDPQGEERADPLQTAAVLTAKSAQGPGDGRTTTGAGVPEVPDVDVPPALVQLQVLDARAREWRQCEAEGAGVHIGLVAGDEPAAQCQQVPEQVGGLARSGVASGEFEVEPAQRVGDVGLCGVALGQTGEPEAVGSQGVAEAVDDVGDVQSEPPTVGGDGVAGQFPEREGRICVGQADRQLTAPACRKRRCLLPAARRDLLLDTERDTEQRHVSNDTAVRAAGRHQS
uniref:Uncharacterized protein n=1 Tax=Streptomyces sp. NBC_00049 TaxID=2903617 RepID=A0AAU2K1J7_9ACTN